jgi:hypothetical protein
LTKRHQFAWPNEWAEDLARKAGANDFVFKDMNYGVNLLEIVAKYFR